MSNKNLYKGSKAVIIGAGNVGATTAYTLALRMVVGEIVLVDLNLEKAIGEVMDLKHGMAYYENLKISAGTYEDCINADYIIITAGAKQNPGETRLELTDRNKKILDAILTETLKYAKDAFYILISNPVDVLTQHALEFSGLKRNQVFGTGTALDTSRFKYLLGKEFNVSPSNIHAYIIGEHGDSSLPVLSHAYIAGIPISEFKGFNKDRFFEIYEETKNAAYEVIKRKGATFYAISLVVSEIVQALEYDQKKILPVSTYLDGEYGLKDICIGVPCILGQDGVEEIIELGLDAEEKEKLDNCVNTLRQYM